MLNHHWKDKSMILLMTSRNTIIIEVKSGSYTIAMLAGRVYSPPLWPLEPVLGASLLTQHRANMTCGLLQLYLPQVFTGTHLSTSGWAVCRLP